jgi:hypothetical protein
MILRELLVTRGFDPSHMVAIRNSLHPDDISPKFRDTIDIVSAKALPMYDRMQDGPRIGCRASPNPDQAPGQDLRRSLPEPPGLGSAACSERLARGGAQHDRVARVRAVIQPVAAAGDGAKHPMRPCSGRW